MVVQNHLSMTTALTFKIWWVLENQVHAYNGMTGTGRR